MYTILVYTSLVYLKRTQVFKISRSYSPLRHVLYLIWVFLYLEVCHLAILYFLMFELGLPLILLHKVWYKNSNTDFLIFLMTDQLFESTACDNFLRVIHFKGMGGGIWENALPRTQINLTFVDPLPNLTHPLTLIRSNYSSPPPHGFKWNSPYTPG